MISYRVDSKTDIIVGNITRSVLHPRDRLYIEQNGCQHQIFSYVQRRYRWKKFKDQNLSNWVSITTGIWYSQNIPIGTYSYIIMGNKGSIVLLDYVL